MTLVRLSCDPHTTLFKNSQKLAVTEQEEELKQTTTCTSRLHTEHTNQRWNCLSFPPHHKIPKQERTQLLRHFTHSVSCEIKDLLKPLGPLYLPESTSHLFEIQSHWFLHWIQCQVLKRKKQHDSYKPSWVHSFLLSYYCGCKIKTKGVR